MNKGRPSGHPSGRREVDRATSEDITKRPEPGKQFLTLSAPDSGRAAFACRNGLAASEGEGVRRLTSPLTARTFTALPRDASPVISHLQLGTRHRVSRRRGARRSEQTCESTGADGYVIRHLSLAPAATVEHSELQV